MRIWEVELVDDDGLRASSPVLAADAVSAAESVLAVIQEDDDFATARVAATREGSAEQRVMDVDVPDPEISTPGVHVGAPRLWKVPYDDGLFQRSAGAALVIADDAVSARALVIDADPFEGRPPYGVPAVYGDAEPFVPTSPYVFWIGLDWSDVPDNDR